MGLILRQVLTIGLLVAPVGRPGISAWMLVAALLRASYAFAANSPIFILQTDAATFMDISVFDRATAQLTRLGSIDPSLGADYSLAAASTGLLYSVTEQGEVLEIVPSPFTVTSLGNIGPNGIVGLAFSDAGVLYADDEKSNALYRIQLSPLSITAVGTIHLPDTSTLPIAGGDIVQAASATWYLWTNSTQALYVLDVTTATVTPVPGQVTGLGWVSGLALDYLGGGTLLRSSSDSSLLAFDPNTGTGSSTMSFCQGCPPVPFGDMASPPASASTTPPPGGCDTLPTFASLGCRLDALIVTMSAARDLGPLRKTLWRRLNRTKPQRAEALARARKRRAAKACLARAISSLTAFDAVVESPTGQRLIAEATRTLLMATADSVLRDMETLRRAL
jgi:hypothetical protein